MKSDYWDVTEEQVEDQVIEKTGKPLDHWQRVLDKFDAANKKSSDVVDYLQQAHRLPRLIISA